MTEPNAVVGFAALPAGDTERRTNVRNEHGRSKGGGDPS
jgi:hypothetical protein